MIMREPYGWFGGCCCCCCLLFADGDYLMLLTRVLRSQGLTGGLLRMYSIPRNNNSAVHDVSSHFMPGKDGHFWYWAFIALRVVVVGCGHSNFK